MLTTTFLQFEIWGTKFFSVGSTFLFVSSNQRNLMMYIMISHSTFCFHYLNFTEVLVKGDRWHFLPWGKRKTVKFWFSPKSWHSYSSFHLLGMHQAGKEHLVLASNFSIILCLDKLLNNSGGRKKHETCHFRKKIEILRRVGGKIVHIIPRCAVTASQLSTVVPYTPWTRTQITNRYK